ncbi:hypothetical protein SLE2022_345700 [Rubroshorea leprosula]
MDRRICDGISEFDQFCYYRDRESTRRSAIFLKGGYVEDFDVQDNGEEDDDGTLVLVNATEKALQLCDSNHNTRVGRTAKSGAEFFLTRSYHGLEMPANNSLPESYVMGQSGKASGYQDEKNKFATCD